MAEASRHLLRIRNGVLREEEPATPTPQEAIPLSAAPSSPLRQPHLFAALGGDVVVLGELVQFPDHFLRSDQDALAIILFPFRAGCEARTHLVQNARVGTREFRAAIRNGVKQQLRRERQPRR